MDQWKNDWILVAIRITDPDSGPDRDTGKTALAEVCTVPVLLIYSYAIDG